MRAVVLWLAITVAGCTEAPDLRQARECAQATALHAQALERLGRPANVLEAAGAATMASVVSAGQYRKVACAHDPSLAGD